MAKIGNFDSGVPIDTISEEILLNFFMTHLILGYTIQQRIKVLPGRPEWGYGAVVSPKALFL